MLQQIYFSLRESQSNFCNLYHFKEAAVFIPLVELENKLHLLFEIRASYLKHQPGDICFPGGKLDINDETPRITALREASEELGVGLDQMTIVGELDYFVSPLGYVIYPFCGQILDPSAIKPNPDEVASFFYIPLEWFIHHQPKISSLNLGYQFDNINSIPLNNPLSGWISHSKIDVLFYCYQDYVIWGLTAEIIQQFLTRIRPFLKEKK